MGRVHVHQYQAMPILCHDVDPVDLTECLSERLRVVIVGRLKRPVERLPCISRHRALPQTQSILAGCRSYVLSCSVHWIWSMQWDGWTRGGGSVNREGWWGRRIRCL